MSEIEIIPTVVPSSLEAIVAAAERFAPFAATLHVDLADGVFAPNTTWLPDRSSVFAGMRWEAHLMVAQPEEVGRACLRAGAARVIGHLEAMRGDTLKTFESWRRAGAEECVLGCLFDTPVAELEPYVHASDALMVMGITAVGVQGLPSDPNTSQHISALKESFSQTLIEVDGAVSEKNIAAYAACGARRFCCGSAISKAPDPAAAYQDLFARAVAAA